MSATPYPTQQTMAIQQPQTVIVQNPEKEYPSFASRKAVSIGGIQLSLGVMAIIFQISATAIDAENGSAAGGIWAGFFFPVAGCIGLTAKTRKSGCKITFYGIFSLTAFLCAIALLILAAIGVDNDQESKQKVCKWDDWDDWDEDWDDLEDYWWYDDCGRYNARIAMNVLLIIIALLEMVVAMYAMVICVQGCCGGKAPKQTALPTLAHTGETVVVYPAANIPRQYIAYPQAPQAQAMAPLAYEDATAPPAYVYYGSGAAAQTSAPSNLHDSYNNPTYQANPPENVYAMADNSVNENKQKGNY